jgi:flavin reductase (DIM6/NTAB) family NADH-FMN oxidoreductase RutF
MKKPVGAKPYIYPAPVMVVGTYDAQGKPDIAPFSWGGICCSDPPCVAVSLRKATYTYHNAMLKKAFTVSIPSLDLIKQTDYTGIVSGRDTDKFSRTKLTPVKSPHVDAPYPAEFPVVIECVVTHTIELGSHTQFIGKVVNTLIEDSLLDKNGYVDIKKLRPFVFMPDSYAYYSVGDFIGQAFSIGEKLT